MAGQPNFSFNNAGYTDPISHAPVTYFLITSYNTANSPAAGVVQQQCHDVSAGICFAGGFSGWGQSAK